MAPCSGKRSFTSLQTGHTHRAHLRVLGDNFFQGPDLKPLPQFEFGIVLFINGKFFCPGSCGKFLFQGEIFFLRVQPIIWWPFCVNLFYMRPAGCKLTGVHCPRFPFCLGFSRAPRRETGKLMATQLSDSVWVMRRPSASNGIEW